MNLFDYENVVKETAVEYGLKVKSRNASFKSEKLCSSAQVAKYIRDLFGDDIDIVESFIVVLLNRSANVVGWSRISTGGRAATVVDSVIIARIAVESLASSVILAHNHPSGNLKPSVQDDALTRKITEALNLFDIRTLDHVIMSPTGDFYSYADEGRL